MHHGHHWAIVSRETFNIPTLLFCASCTLLVARAGIFFIILWQWWLTGETWQSGILFRKSTTNRVMCAVFVTTYSQGLPRHKKSFISVYAVLCLFFGDAWNNWDFRRVPLLWTVNFWRLKKEFIDFLDSMLKILLRDHSKNL